MDGVLTEADYDRAVCMIGAEEHGDPLAALLSEGRKVLDLTIDVEGRLQDMRKVLKNNCHLAIGCLFIPCCTICTLITLATDDGSMSCNGESKRTRSLQGQANAHHLAITDSAVVYIRDAHSGYSIKNYIAYDQYGHRFPAVNDTESQVPAATLHVPLQHAELEVCAKRDIESAALNGAQPSDKCCDNKPDASVIVLRVGEGVRLVVACIEVGPASNADAFLAEFARLKSNAPALSPELAAAYNSWFGQRLVRSGTMAGAAPRANQTMDRGGVPGQAGKATVPFVRSVGPLPANLAVQDGVYVQDGRFSIKTTVLNALSLTLEESGNINRIKTGPFIGQLNAHDQVLSINNVPAPPGRVDSEYINQAQAAAPGGGGFMQVSTGAPHFQPSHMLTVGPMPPGATAAIQFDSNRLPPTILQPDAAAATAGLLKGDVVMQAILDGVTHNTNGMTGQQLLNLTQAAKATVLTVLQTHRMPSGPTSELPWVPFKDLPWVATVPWVV